MEFWESSSESILLFGPATAMSLVANRLGLSNTGSALPGVFGVLGPCWIIHTREGQGINIAQCSFSIVFQSCRSRSGQSGHGHCNSRRLSFSDSRNLRTSAWLVALVLGLGASLVPTSGYKAKPKCVCACAGMRRAWAAKSSEKERPIS